MTISRVAALAITVVFAVQLNAEVVTLTAQNAGNYTSFLGSELHDPNNTLVANSNGFVSNSYLVFDLGTIGDTIVSLDLAGSSGGDAARTDDVEIEFSSFSGSVSQLVGGTLNTNDLENGVGYGGFFADATFPDDSPFSLTLNPTAVEDANDSAGLFVIAATQPIVTGTSGFLGDVRANEFTLTVTTAIPEPTSLPVLAGLAIGFVVCRRKR
ncbi:MAG: PEP-CTERM sorting domain-containing protein [Planctomycetota bacterium]